MIPIHDDNPTRTFPWVTVAFIVANVAVFAFEFTRTPAELTALIETWAFVPAHFFSAPSSPHEIATVFAAMFMHASWLHIGGNMLYLWIFGNNIEDRLGPIRFIAFYLICGVVASLAQGAAAPTSTTPLLGASGAIAGVLGAYLLLYPRARVLTIIPIFFIIEMAALPSVFVIGFWFVLQLVQGLGDLNGAVSGGVAWWAHVGGFAAGAVMILPFAISDGVRRARRRR